MKTTALIVSLFLVLLTPSAVYAAPANNPVFATLAQVRQLISTAISEVQNQISNLDQRLSAVESNATTRTYTLLDSSNQELGTLVDGFAIGEQKTVFNDQYKRFITFHASSGQVNPNSNLFHSTNNCTGDAYVEGPWLNDYIFRVGNSTTKLAMVDTSVAPTAVSVHSYSDGENCAPFNENEGNAYRATVIQPYNQPVNPPFRITAE